MLPRSEYPRPQFRRDHFTCLNGQWDFMFDDKNTGLNDSWYQDTDFDLSITVPYVHQSELSGIHDTSVHDVVWYKRQFTVESIKKTLLHFGAVDYKADVWVNGQHVTMHEGGHVGFSVDITHVLEKTNTLVLRVEDESRALDLPRGKQYWRDDSASIYYTRTTGIWQTVWFEQVPDTYLKSVYMTPIHDDAMLDVLFETNGAIDVTVTIKYKGTELIHDTISVKDQSKRRFYLDPHLVNDFAHPHLWSWTPEKPNLFDITFDYKDDTIESYFAMRKISVENGQILLNSKPYYQKLLLDQGYWRKGILTAPSDQDFIRDIELSKEMGYNGCRKHQKTEDPRFMYHADQMGFLVWGEAANAITFSRRGAERFTKEWMEIIKRDYNHPCIITWVPINESWGVESIKVQKHQQDYATALYYLTKGFDDTRLVVSNDGWDHTKSDVFTIHDYQSNKATLKTFYGDRQAIQHKQPADRTLMAPGWSYNNEPIIMSEMGGISYQKDETTGWGYSNATSDEDFIQRYEAVISAMHETASFNGYCYTQLTDVEQEINGLLTYDRIPKVDLKRIKAITEGK